MQDGEGFDVGEYPTLHTSGDGTKKVLTWYVIAVDI